MRRLSLLAAVACALALSACGNDSGGGSSTTGKGSATATTATTPTTPTLSTTTGVATTRSAPKTCQDVQAPAPKDVGAQRKPTALLNPAKTWTVTMATSCGDFAFTLDVKRQPRTAASFAGLVRRRFFDGLTFHRIVPGFVIQGGDPQGDGSGGPGYSVTEKPPADATYRLGTVAMAKTADEPAGTSGSQFFVVTGDDAGLPPDYAVLGKVVSGLDTVKRIEAVATDPSSQQPTSPVVIDTATLAGS